MNDDHVCPLVDPASGTPHKGGAILGPSIPTVKIGGQFAAVLGDTCACNAAPPDTIAAGSATVFIGGKPAARMGDMTAHGGTITAGEMTVNIG